MAHFALIDSKNIVRELIVVNNDVLVNDEGVEEEALGQGFIASLGLEGTWLQCSYNGNIRAHYPAPGYIYEPDLDVFILPQPFPSWSLNEETFIWEPPISYPSDDKVYVWDEATGSWVEVPGS